MTLYASLSQEPTLLFAPTGWTDGYVTGSDGVRYAVIDNVAMLPSLVIGAAIGVGFTRAPATTAYGGAIGTFLDTPTSANLAAALGDETGSGALVFADTPTLVTPVLGTPTSGTLTNCTGPWGEIRFAQVVTTGSATTIVFSSLPTDGSYTNLEIWLTARDVVNSAQVSMYLKMNTDATAANYTTAQLGQTSGGVASHAGVASTTSGMFVGNLAGVNGNANACGSYRISVPNYANTTFHKPVFVHFEELDSAGPTQRAGDIGATWLSAAAINQLTITTAGTNFVNGCIATCYLKK